VIGWGGLAQPIGRYEVLVGDESQISWKRFDGKPNIRGFQPIDAGREQDGSLYVMHFQYV
jgi:hypothetical protein